jgi:hypothetical protein
MNNAGKSHPGKNVRNAKGRNAGHPLEKLSSANTHHHSFIYYTKWVRLVIFGELKGSDPFHFPLLLWRQLAAF